LNLQPSEQDACAITIELHIW